MAGIIHKGSELHNLHLKLHGAKPVAETKPEPKPTENKIKSEEKKEK